MKMRDDAGWPMYPVRKNELCAAGEELWNCGAQSIYGAAGTPAFLPVRENFAPEYKQILSGNPQLSPLYNH